MLEHHVESVFMLMAMTTTVSVAWAVVAVAVIGTFVLYFEGGLCRRCCWGREECDGVLVERFKLPKHGEYVCVSVCVCECE
eukprot:m.16164 g.16164  ORF g.16164 m.16164 type:complete len:81 (-) comp4574_c1_seq2:245-487(-)